MPHVLHSTCSPMHRMYRICICGCQAIYIQVRPLRKGKFNGRIHGLLPVSLPGYILLFDDVACKIMCSKSSSSKTHTLNIFSHWTSVLLLLLVLVLLVLVFVVILCVVFFFQCFLFRCPNVVKLISPMTNVEGARKAIFSRVVHMHYIVTKISKVISYALNVSLLS